jgi:hypothetical protein
MLTTSFERKPTHWALDTITVGLMSVAVHATPPTTIHPTSG